jgi:diguanylate cyclase (GGDEF)-like protein
LSVTRDWPSSNLLAELNSRAWSQAEFEHAIEQMLAEIDSPLDAVMVSIEQSEPMPAITIGAPGQGKAQHISTVRLDKLGRFTAMISLWFKPETTAEEEQPAVVAIPELVLAYWRGDERDQRGKILSGQFAGLQRALEATTQYWTAQGPVALLFADIDRFKAWNDTFGMQDGDRLIARLSALLVHHAPADAVVVHRTGDEFVIVLPRSDLSVAVVEAMALRETVERKLLEPEPPLPMKGTRIGLSIGVAGLPQGSLFSYSSLETQADRALKPAGEEKRRGRVSVETSLGSDTAVVSSSPSTDTSGLATCLVLSQFDVATPFGNTWLNVLSLRARELTKDATDVSGLSSALSRLVNLVDPMIHADVHQALVPAQSGLNGLLALSPLEVVLAISHGLGCSLIADDTQIGDGWTLHYADKGAAASIVQHATGAVLISLGDNPTVLESIPIAPTTDSHHQVIDSHRALLISIGTNRLKLPRQLFAEIVYVDDRPTRGGGLPDFWEAAIAQVITALVCHPNISLVLATGERTHGIETLTRLEQAAAWSHPETVDDLAYKLGHATAPIRMASERIAGRVTHVQNSSTAIRLVLEQFRTGIPLKAVPTGDVAIEPPREHPLRRTLRVEKLGLGLEGGCQVGTAYEAFPIALELVRQTEQTPMRDQAGRPFKELVDFRISLRTPTREPIPRFHRKERKSLENYFEQQFINPTGLFRKQLNLHDQLELVIEHVVQTVPQRTFTSRRALLVVPHIPVVGEELSPLGLVSVRIIPYSSETGSITLDYSFTWRTVEALVGLPYSLYASIRFAEYLTEQIRSRLAPREQRALVMRRLSYIAHSLHIFLDNYAESIARRIVNDETS